MSFKQIKPTKKIKARLEYLRGELKAERISTEELIELQDLAAEGCIEPGDVELLEAAGVPEKDAHKSPIPHPSKAICIVIVNDPDTNGPVPVEIRKDVITGALTGFDGSYLEKVDDDLQDPYNRGELISVPDDEEGSAIPSFDLSVPVVGITKQPDWKQANPRDQLVEILMGVEGSVSNLLKVRHSSYSIVLYRLQEAQTILKNMPPGEWAK